MHCAHCKRNTNNIDIKKKKSTSYPLQSSVDSDWSPLFILCGHTTKKIADKQEVSDVRSGQVSSISIPGSDLSFLCGSSQHQAWPLSSPPQSGLRRLVRFGWSGLTWLNLWLTSGGNRRGSLQQENPCVQHLISFKCLIKSSRWHTDPNNDPWAWLSGFFFSERHQNNLTDNHGCFCYGTIHSWCLRRW